MGGLASLALLAHFVRLSALRASVRAIVALVFSQPLSL
jgi:hypothetical protein